MDPASRRPGLAGRGSSRKRRPGGPGRPEGRADAGGRGRLLPGAVGHRDRSRPVVPHAGTGVVPPRRGGRRGVLPGGARSERAGDPSTGAGRVLPDGRRRAAGRRRRRGHLPAVRLGPRLAQRPAAGPGGLSRAHERARPGLRDGGSRASGGAERGDPDLRPGRRAARRVERLRGEARHPRGAALRGRGRGRAALRNRLAGPRPPAGNHGRGLPAGAGRGGRGLAAAGGLPDGRKRRSPGPERPARRPGTVVAVPGARDPGGAGLPAGRGRRGGPGGPARGTERPPRTQAPVPPPARDAGPLGRKVRRPGGGGRRIHGHRGVRGPAAGAPAAGSRRVRGPDGGAVSPRGHRSRFVPALRRRARASAPRGGRSADPPLQQRRPDPGGSLPEGAGGARREQDAPGRGARAPGPPAGGPPPSGDRGGGGDGFRDHLRPAGTARGPVHLHLHGHLRRLLRGGRVPLRRRRRMYRVPPARRGEGADRPGLRTARLRPADRVQRAARHPLPAGDAGGTAGTSSPPPGCWSPSRT